MPLVATSDAMPRVSAELGMFAQVAVFAMHRDQHDRASGSRAQSPDRGGWHGPRRGRARSLSSTTSTPISENAFTIRSTSRSLPGNGLGGEQEQIPLLHLHPQILAARQLRRRGAPFALAAGHDQHQVAARHFQRLFRGQRCAGSPSAPRPLRAAATILFIARPSRQIDRPAAFAASASVFRRATFEANVVATTMPLAPCDQLADRVAQRGFPTGLHGSRRRWSNRTSAPGSGASAAISAKAYRHPSLRPPAAFRPA